MKFPNLRYRIRRAPTSREWFLRDRESVISGRLRIWQNNAISNGYSQASAQIICVNDGPSSISQEFFYHYTKLETFRSIISSKSLWASHYSILNDENEIGFSWDLIEKRIFYKKDINKFHIYQEFFSKLKNAFFNEFDLYILSFSSTPHLLSQWRAYAFPFGVSIGFSSGLFHCTENQKFIVGRVIYDAKEQIKIIDMSIFDALQKLENINFQSSLEYDVIISECCNNLREIVPFIKHPSFIEENEIRLITSGNGMHIGDRPDGRGRYAKIDLDDIFDKRWEEDFIFSQVWAGPHSNPDDYITEIQSILDNYKIPFQTIIYCGIPLRSVNLQ